MSSIPWNLSIKPFCIGFAWFDELECCAMLLGPFSQCHRDQFWPIVPSKVRLSCSAFLAYGDSAQEHQTKEQPSMTESNSTARARILVAIDIAKAKHEVLVELPTGKRRKMIVSNQLRDFKQLAAYLKRLDGVLEIALEPTADYHRNLAYFLKTSFRAYCLRLKSTPTLIR
jgi:Transposase